MVVEIPPLSGESASSFAIGVDKMEFSRLARVVSRPLIKKSDTLVIIPIYKEYAVLGKHLGLLARQTTSAFDVLLVLSSESEEKEANRQVEKYGRRLNVIISKRLSETGSAGGFFTGQKIALEKGYAYMVLADADCFPLDKKVMHGLLKNKKSGYVRAKVEVVSKDKRIRILMNEGGVATYCLLSSEIVRKYGLYFAPLYYGADDAEYAERLPKNFNVINAICSHPFGSDQFSNIRKSMLFLTNALAVVRSPGFFAFLLRNFVVYTSVMFVFFPDYGRKVAFAVLESVLLGRYGKRVKNKLFSIEIPSVVPGNGNRVVSGLAPVIQKDKHSLPSTKFMPILFSAVGNFRKDVLITQSNSGLLIHLHAMFARKAFYSSGDGKYIPITDNSDIIIHALRISLFLLLFLPYSLCTISAISILKLFRPIKTMGYGL